jgi:hypothetical protein
MPYDYFQQGRQYFDPKKHGSSTTTRIPSQQKFDPEGSGYDYLTAREAGITPTPDGHWGSRDPRTGMLLKGKRHKTFWMTEEAEKKGGYEIYKGANNRYYSRKKK